MKRQWRKGPPPSIGWWPASMCEDYEAVRWWDGKKWSVPTYPFQSKEQAAKNAKKRALFPANVMWTDRWWL